MLKCVPLLDDAAHEGIMNVYGPDGGRIISGCCRRLSACVRHRAGLNMVLFPGQSSLPGRLPTAAWPAFFPFRAARKVWRAISEAHVIFYQAAPWIVQTGKRALDAMASDQRHSS